MVSGWHFLTKLCHWTQGPWMWQPHAFFHQLNVSTSWVQGPGQAAQGLRVEGSEQDTVPFSRTLGLFLGRHAVSTCKSKS